jgi:hypothetical protein
VPWSANQEGRERQQHCAAGEVAGSPQQDEKSSPRGGDAYSMNTGELTKVLEQRGLRYVGHRPREDAGRGMDAKGSKVA